MARQSIWFGSLAFLLAATFAAAQDTGSISGQVTDRVNGAPLAGVDLALQGAQLFRNVYTDSDGRFEFEGLPADDSYVLFTRFANGQGFLDQG